MKENRQQWRSESPDRVSGGRLRSGSEAAPRRSAFGGRPGRSFGLRFRPWAAGLLAGALLAGGCGKQTSEDPVAGGEKVAVRFDIDGFGSWAAQSYAVQSISGGGFAASGQGASATRAASAPALNTTVRVIAYKSGSGNPAQANYADDRAYYWDGTELVPCTVDDSGNKTDGTAQPMELVRKAAYDFYAVSPALPLAEDKTALKTAVDNGMDYATSVTKIASLAVDGAITLETLERQCARVGFKVMANSSEWVAPTSMSINSVTIGGLPDAQSGVKPGAALTAATGGTRSLTLQSADFTGSGTTYVVEPRLVLPMEDATLTFSFDLVMDGVRTTFDDELRFSPERGKNYTVTAEISAENALSLAVAEWSENSDNNPSLGGDGYPYVVEGTNVIVCADAYGQADPAKYPLHAPWKMYRMYGTDYPAETPQHEEDGASSNINTGEGGFVNNATGLNAVSARFEVAKTVKFVTAWTDARQFCLNYDTPAGSKGQWRLPTYLELRLIYEKKGELTMGATTDTYYWSATKVQNETSYWSPNFSKGTVSEVSSGSTVRCVRDL